MTDYARRQLQRCTIRPDGLILRSEQQNMPDASNVFRMLLRHRAIVPVCRGVYALAGTWATLHGWERFRLQAVGLGAPRGRILAGYSAAVVHGLWTYVSVPAAHHLYRRRNGAGLQEKMVVKELFARLPAGDVTAVSQTQVTTVARTVVDLTRVHGFGAGFVAACSALRQGATTTEHIESAARPLRGSALLPLLLENTTPVLESAQEAMFLAQVVFFGDVTVTPQVEIACAKGRTYRVDFRVNDTSEYIELDGDEKYGATAQDQQFSLRREKERADALARAGVVPKSYTYRQVASLQAYRGTLSRVGLPVRNPLPTIHLL